MCPSYQTKNTQSIKLTTADGIIGFLFPMLFKVLGHASSKNEEADEEGWAARQSLLSNSINLPETEGTQKDYSLAFKSKCVYKLSSRTILSILSMGPIDWLPRCTNHGFDGAPMYLLDYCSLVDGLLG